MVDIVIAPSEVDAAAAEAVVAHHAEMLGVLTARSEELLTAVHADPGAASAARDRLVAWSRADLVPHALAEEEAMYPRAGATVEGRLLVEAMLAEHGAITHLVDELAAATEPVRMAAAAGALRALFAAHLAKENDQVLPLLLATAGVSVADLLGGMHELLGAHAGHDHAGHGHPHAEADGADAVAADGHHGCQCGESAASELPEIDVQTIPHEVRHATLFGALDAVRPGAGLVLRATHDPVPLLNQLAQRAPGAFEVAYLERGPEQWRLEFRRTGA